MTNRGKHPQISPELEKQINLCANLPSLPAVALNIIEASKDPDISLHEVSEIISSDPAISVKLLKVANSPLYSQRRSLNNLRETLTLLGFNASLTIALSFSLLQSLGSDNNITHENYWKRSILSASIARMLGIRLRVARLEDLFLASLLQDIGILVIQCIKNSPYPDDDSYNLKHDDCVKFEKEVLGVEHPVVGAWLMKSWNLPENLVNAVMFSHSLNRNDVEQNIAESHFHYCLHLSGSLADVWLNDDPSTILLSILDVAKRILKVDNDEFNQIIVEIDDALPEITSMFDISLVQDKNREHVLNEARELLLERSIHSIKQSEDDRRYIDSITDRVEQIEKESRLDHLTKVYNRQYIDHLLDVEYEESNINHWPLSVAFIDIDDFKSVNDDHGHLIGDEVLKFISTFFSDNIRQTDVLARYGGDEFILMLPGSTSEIAQGMIERLLNLYNEKSAIHENGSVIKTTVTIGLATHLDQHDFDSSKKLIQAADEAVYKAKAKGKNCLVVY